MQQNLQLLKVLLREANETEFNDKRGGRRKLLSDHSYGVWSAMAVEIGKLIGGWIAAIEESNKKSGNKA